MMQLGEKDLLIFDLDGTIVHLKVRWEELKNQLNDRYSNLYWNNCDYSSISLCLSKIIDEDDDEELQNFFEIIRKYELENIEKTEPISDIVYFINNLEKFGVKTSVKLAIFSLNLRETIIKALEISNLKEKFEFLVGREDVRRWKPNSEGLLKVINHFNIEKDRTIYFGDMKKDQLAGENAGVDFYYVSKLVELVEKIKEKNKF